VEDSIGFEDQINPVEVGETVALDDPADPKE